MSILNDGLLPDIVLDRLNALDELVDETQSRVGGLTNPHSSSEDGFAHRELKKEDDEENEQTVDGILSNLSR